VKSGEVLNQKVKAYAVDKHDGTLGKRYSFATTDADNVVIKALKKAERGDELVVRMYETAGKSIDANVIFDKEIISASEADGTEKSIGDASFTGNKLTVSMKPNSVRTYRLKLKGEMVKSPDCVPLDLRMNKKCFTWNEFRNNGNFDFGYSYAAELVPSEIMAGNVVFKLNVKDELNGKACLGDTIKLDGAYDKVYILAASTSEKGTNATFKVGGTTQTVSVPYYTGFIGQWGHKGHTEGFLKDDYVAFVGTHRHSVEGDHPYEFTYMFRKEISIPKGATEIILPNDRNLVIFAATAVSGKPSQVKPASEIFRTAILDGSNESSAEVKKENILSPDKIIGYSGFINDKEKPQYAVDGDERTKWCEVESIPSYIDFDLGKPEDISGWYLLSAGMEGHDYITSDCFVMGKENVGDEWTTLDYIKGNKKNVISRSIKSRNKVRYIRLLITAPNQSVNNIATRIYEFKVFR
jgi:alpha-mannosidase